MTCYFTSDTHFTDPRVLRIDQRPFNSVSAHDEALIANWNQTVGTLDEVWHLGDFGRGTTNRIDDILQQLHGTKHLIIGNNDESATLAAVGFASRQHYAELVIAERLLILCHYPFRTWNQMGKGAINLHGHSHGKLSPATRQRDVGVDAWNYRPVAVEQLVQRRRRRT